MDASKEQSESQQQSESEEQTMSKEQTNSKEELPEGNKFELVIRNWDDYQAIDAKNNVILDFVDENGNDVSTDEDRMFVDLNGFSYKDRTGKLVKIERCIRIRHLNCGQVFRVLDLDQRDIRARIFANHLRVELTTIAQLDFNHRRVINNVVVGDDIAFIGINDDAGTQPTIRTAEPTIPLI